MPEKEKAKEQCEKLLAGGTLDDMMVLDYIGRGCRMGVVSAEFEERGGVLRLKRVVLLSNEFDNSNPDAQKVIFWGSWRVDVFFVQ